MGVKNWAIQGGKSPYTNLPFMKTHFGEKKMVSINGNGFPLKCDGFPLKGDGFPLQSSRFPLQGNFGQNLKSCFQLKI